MIPYGRQSLDDHDIDAVVEVLRGDWLTQGPTIDAFEQELAARVEAKHAVTFANGTAALHGAMAAAGIGPGDRVLTSPLSFVASANCGRFVGADVGFVDIDPETWNLDVTAVGPCDALVPVHYAGLPVALDELAARGNRPRVVVEDACHALGARTPYGPVGNCAHSDMTVFSFHPVKSITTGEGGAVTTNSDELADALRRFRCHGMVRRPEVAGWYYEIEELGYNYRITDLQAALGRSQLAKLGSFVAMRNALADRYRSRFAEYALPGLVMPPAAEPGWRHAYHLFPVLVTDRDGVYARLRDLGVGTQVHYLPIYRHPLYARTGIDPRDFPVTEHVFHGILSLPLHPTLTRADQDTVIEAVVRVLSDDIAAAA